MDITCLTDWNTEIEVELPLPGQRRQLGVDNELMELLWENGEVVLNSQTHRKSNYDPIKFKQVHKNDQLMSRIVENPTNLIQDDETISWIHCPIDESFEKEFCSNFLTESPLSNIVEANKLSGNFEGENLFKFGASDVNHVLPSSRQPKFAPISLPPPRFETSESARQDQNLEGVRKTSNLDFPVKRPEFNHTGQGEIHELSVMTIGSSHCGSNQVASSCGIGSRTLSAGLEENYARKVSPRSDSMERETLEPAITSSSGGSGSSLWKTGNQSNDTNCLKRKSRDVEESECQSDATELESASGNKSSQKSGTTRRSRVAEVHNLSERRRRDRINEKMKALQELIPHSNKSDKASMLDEAIEYMKSLQSQIQLMWMGTGMAPMVLPGMQQYLSRMGMGIGPAMIPPIHNIMRLSRLPLVDQAMTIPPSSNHATIGLRPVLNPVNYQNQMQSPSLPEQYANYMNLYSMQNTSQPMNMFGFGTHSSQQNHVLAPPGNGNGNGNGSIA